MRLWGNDIPFGYQTPAEITKLAAPLPAGHWLHRINGKRRQFNSLHEIKSPAEAGLFDPPIGGIR